MGTANGSAPTYAELSEAEKQDAPAKLLKALLLEKSINEALFIWQKAVFPNGRSGYFDD